MPYFQKLNTAQKSTTPRLCIAKQIIFTLQQVASRNFFLKKNSEIVAQLNITPYLCNVISY